jgi:DNA gyrase subunit A
MSNENNIIDTDVVNELENSFLEYSMSVIVSRALPDVRDGLKPVHRRVLYSLYEQGIRPDTPHKKCARVVGDVMGKYHPHGESSIYEALVRMAQNWSMRYLLIDGHGNFGSPDDGPAAMRYTECRLSDLAFLMIDEINEDTVDFNQNYDQTEVEPESLPSKIPNLIINGSSGIAVGMATNMPPHNLNEVTKALIHLINYPKTTFEEILNFIPGPDLPTGGTIIYDTSLYDGYKTGRGSFKIRAKAIFEKNGKKDCITITELPYQVGPERIISKIKELVNNKKIEGISDIKDYSGRKTGLRLVIEIKNGFNKEKVLNNLYKLTPIEETFSINNVTLVRGEPKTLSLIEILNEFINNRIIVMRRRTNFRLNKDLSRIHIVDGLLIALTDIEEVIFIIKSSKDVSKARNSLKEKYQITDIQANAILDMTLKRLTGLELGKLKKEYDELEKSIKYLKALLESESKLKNLLISELEEISAKFHSPRKSILQYNNTDSELIVIKDNSIIEVSTIANKYIYKQKKDENFDPLVFANEKIVLENSDDLLFVSNLGKLHRIPASKLPYTNSSLPVEINDFINIPSGEHIVGIIQNNREAILVTKLGKAKRISLGNDSKRSGSKLIKLLESDQIIAAFSIDNTEEYITLLSKNALMIKFKLSTIPLQGFGTSGVKAMKLKDDYIVLSRILREKSELFILTNNNKYKISILQDIPERGRGSGGIKVFKLDLEDFVKTAYISQSQIVLVNSKFKNINKKYYYSKRDSKGIECDLVFKFFSN